MKRLLVLFVFCALAVTMSVSTHSSANAKKGLISAAASPVEITYKFTVVNKTGYNFKKLYVSPHSAEEWDDSDELLKGSTFNNGTSAELTYVTAKNASTWDFMVMWDDGTANSKWENVDLNGVSTLTFTYDRSTDTTTINKS